MSKKVAKTNALRILDSKKTSYEMYEYDISDELIDGKSVCEKLGISELESLKTLVAHGKGNAIYVFVVSINSELDLKKAATICGEKKIEMLAVKDLLGITGYIRGGCSPIGMKKLYPTFIDIEVKDLETIYVSGGRKGLSIGISPGDLANIVNGEFGDIVKKE
ncbi:Cys-tRNA(Pro) deacylase [Myroides odoratimimus]|uniref:Cys-tRNA(Pro)/Cys-tRNA(Cys) deacylase n=1 Tax=Myroides odoratimimus CCUG 10230 TaxID=883150 RepID=A0ABN0E8Y4_9FLAO|nr:Cys-tRNA(Pro) deacylase [Myroides odoratimimus]EHO08547.1 ybaK/ebsC protein [Myroides odoratimimus CCUG 10230]EPH12415.1 YbaK/EbsC protein [Myroides odoratimimus CCUG 12700]MDM1065003.1 Cys-tRNA(Pro) deacylase [Myroides odoratimimus]MDM1499409.1 Cys-tRNA(Pro) deacylase [Myroides odoratimimus]MDM1512662.1 Cys-tRNA(Pro) deacylase [Myroides odoratimimus]